jgi:N-acetylmuramoyl-L-alanine amidase
MSDSKAMSGSKSASGTDTRADSQHADRVYPSPNHGERKGCEKTGKTSPDCVILHYTGMASASEALLWLANPLSEVSCHYFVFEDGRIWQMVPENRRAWHAGRSSWQGETDMNSRSIGIEIVNSGHDLSIPGPLPPPGPPFPDAQIDAVIRLVKDIATRWNIPARRILAHSDLAPGRKIDPGEGFPWATLAAAGVGLWPGPALRGGEADAAIQTGGEAGARKDWIASSQAPRNDAVHKGPSYRLGDEGMPVAALQSMFAKFGYGLEITGVYDQRTFDVVVAFQRHWRQGRVDGVADGETVGALRAFMGSGQA